jgi:tripartite-type tricarboxylate transporter receptor subunit TctC
VKSALFRCFGALLLTFGLWGCAGAGTDSEAADGARAFFRGKTMTYIVATDPGGGYDTYGRLISKYLTRHLGLGVVVVKNIPGGGHVRGMNVIHAARPDGLTLGTFNTGLIYAQLLGRDGLPGDLRRMSWVGKAGLEPRVLTMSAKSGFRSLEDIRSVTRPLLLGTNGVGNESYYDSLLLAHALDLRIRLVFGMASREAQLSMMRGEIDGEVGSLSTYRAFIRNGYGFAVLRVGRGEGVDESIADAGHLTTTADGKAIVDFVASLAELLRWTAGPPGIPEDRLTVLRDGYMSALRDPDLLAEARKLDIPIAPMDGATLAREIDGVLDLRAEMVALIRSIAKVEQQRPSLSP